MQTEELDTFTEGDSLSLETSCSSGAEETSENGHRLLLGLRRGSACRQLHPLSTFQQIDNGIGEIKTRDYIKKVENCNLETKLFINSTTQDKLTEDEVLQNKELFEDLIANEFPEEDMIEKSFRDKVRSFSFF